MKTLKITVFCLCFLLSSISPVFAAPAKSSQNDPWKKWLKEIDPIITSQERSVAKLLHTVEERKRFKELFWKARNPNPHNPQNQYKIEYYRRLAYVNRKLGGPRSDRGGIYILLGKPFQVDHFTGQQHLVSCEMWEYRTDGRHGLFPFMNIVFYKPREMGDYQLYHPGIHTARDLLSPYYAENNRGVLQAYRQIKKNSIALAEASLSIIPGEGVPGANMSLNSSNFALSKVYNLPEREVEAGYVRSFKTPTGTVQVTHSTKEIRGHGYVAAGQNKGITFINYAVLPDVMNLKHVSLELYAAEINLFITIEDETGTAIYQNQRTIDLKVTPQKKQEIQKRKIVFMNFAPIIEGNFTVTIMFLNKTTQEFFTIREKVVVSRKIPPVITGFKLKPLSQRDTHGYMPFAAGNFLVIVDPRGTFSQKDALEGIVRTSQPPEIFLQHSADKNLKIKIEPLVKVGNLYKFRLPLTGVKDDSYLCRITLPGGKAHPVTRKIHVLPFYIDVARPVTMAKPEPASSLPNYRFVQAQQYLNSGKVDSAVQYFEKIPPQFHNAVSLPVIAKAYYMKKEYARVIALLEREEVNKVYGVLIMLANASIELKKFDQAVKYLEQLRKYGDSVQVNQLLAASFLSLGKPEKAKTYYEHARKLLKK
ncbi:MAG: GWxTD domain-containing protein [bacterium]|nr:GWxTD domain-containing protein [bacterium]